MQTATIIFPHQLFKEHPAIEKNRPIFLVEEWLFFKQYNFHQQKLILHRATMQFYKNYLIEKGYSVEYIESENPLSDVRQLIVHLAEKGITAIHYCEVVDNWLNKRIEQTFKQNNIQPKAYTTPNFLNTMVEAADFFDKKKTYFQTDFYIDQRKKRNLLLDDAGKPIGGKWTFDAENRSKFPKNEIVPKIDFPAENKYVVEAKKYVDEHFSKNYGINTSSLKNFYPTTFEEAEVWLENFLQNRFNKFGIYEDAIVAKENYLYHSILTPMLNVGLLNPQQIIDATLQHAAKHDIPLNSLEGFVRQITGWREFIRIVYEREGSKQRTTNYWKFTRKIPASFWQGETGILPIDTTIKKTLKTAYNHHIERLMILGNFYLLCEFDPNEVHQWFMEMYIDAYDWVMVPNVYGMTQFADGGIMTTKPYISGSNYLMKMGDFEKGKWQEIWDALFWRFMWVHKDFFRQNPRLGMLLNTWDKMPEEKKQNHLNIAENYLASLDRENN
jgi:deoxyribodipyrimidine photolyase-related protein